MIDQAKRAQGGMTEQLMELLEYRVVLGALVTTLDGLLVAQAGLSDADAEMLSATSATQPDDEAYSFDTTRGGILHVLRGRDIRLIVLTESGVPRPAVTDLMAQHLAALETSIAG